MKKYKKQNINSIQEGHGNDNGRSDVTVSFYLQTIT